MQAIMLRQPGVDVAKADGSQDVLLIRFETDAGITGFGESTRCRPWSKPSSRPCLARHLHRAAPFAVGRELARDLPALAQALPRLDLLTGSRDRPSTPSAASTSRCGASTGRRRASRSERMCIARAAAIWCPLAETQDALARDGLAFLRGQFR